ncbi:MAG: hypothetical protein ACE5H8_02175 [Alphaproteobacteria bacterium]
MARDLTAAVKTESQSDIVRPVVIVKLELASGNLLVWSGRGALSWNGETYQGVGDLGRIGAIEEGVEQRAFGVSLELSGIPAATLSIALGEDVQGRPAQVWVGFLDVNHGLIADPVLVFRGRIDTMDVTLGETATVTLTAESRLVDWERARVRRYTDADQQERFPGDLGFAFVNETVEKEIVWGGAVAGGKRGGPVAAGEGNNAATVTRETGGGR